MWRFCVLVLSFIQASFCSTCSSSDVCFNEEGNGMFTDNGPCMDEEKSFSLTRHNPVKVSHDYTVKYITDGN